MCAARHLIGRPQIDYDSQSDLLYKLAAQAIDHLNGYLSSRDDVENVALAHGVKLAELIFQQMQQHYRETPADYKAKVVRSFRTLKPLAVSIGANSKMLDVRTPAFPLSDTRKCLFVGTKKSPYSHHKFQSDPERRFAAMIDSDFEKNVLRWLKPGPGQFAIEYLAGKTYEPDFVVELTGEKLIVEIKADNEVQDRIVQEKSRAAAEWVNHANALAIDGLGKSWAYLLVPESAVRASTTLAGLMSSHRRV